ncbi:MAG: AraC family transcriptional regulator, partial [Ruminococcaceae bacterium]|nr:AraC family transcriptional regulator [Oscillospiraceae bacterium]
MMKPEILNRLSYISDEEKRILEGEQKINKKLYSAFTKEFIINHHRLMQEGEQIA